VPEPLILKLDLIQTLALSCVVYYCGILIKRAVPVLDRLNIPAAVIGGLLFASANLIAHGRWLNIGFETSAQPFFMVLFFTTIGMSASFGLLRQGGVQVVLFLVISTLFCLVQNFVGIGVSTAMGVPPLLGVIAGSVTLVGGPATGLAFAPLFETAGVTGAGTLAITAATFGIVCGGIIGGPVGTRLIRKFSLHARANIPRSETEHELHPEAETITLEIGREDSPLVMNIIVAAAAMGIGSVVSYYFRSWGWTLPAYIGAMLVASVMRNADERTRWFSIDIRIMELLGTVSLNIFLVVALMDLKLWELLNLALPLAVILCAQVLIVVVFALTACFRLMGKDYESAVMASGFIGFVLGTTANAVANMKTLVEKYGPAPRAFLVVPMVGAFFIDFTNAIIITLFLNWFR
jgi:ESS family glutamate:Na+ symporter